MDSWPASAPHRNSRRIALAALVLITSGPLASRPSLQTVRLIAGDGETSVILSADGALPSPKVGVLTDSAAHLPRFPGRRGGDRRNTRQRGPPGPRSASGGQPIAAFGDSRRDDLARLAPHRIEAGLRDSGQRTIVVGVPPPRPHGAGRRSERSSPPQASRGGASEGSCPSQGAGNRACRSAGGPRGASRVPTVAADGAPHRRRGRRGVGLSLCRWRAAFAGGWRPHRSAGHLPRFPGRGAGDGRTTRQRGFLVRGVRVAVNQSRPLVTRVVIDLARLAPYRIEAGQRASGQLTIVVGVPVALAGAPPPRPRGAGRRSRRSSPTEASPGGASEGRCPSQRASNGERRACSSAGRTAATAGWGTDHSRRPFARVRARRRSDGCPSAREGCCS